MWDLFLPTSPISPHPQARLYSNVRNRKSSVTPSSSAMPPIQGAIKSGKLYLLNLSWIHRSWHWLPPSLLPWIMPLASLVFFLYFPSPVCDEIKKKKKSVWFKWSCLSSSHPYKKPFTASLLLEKAQSLISAYKALFNTPPHPSPLLLNLSTFLSLTGL